MWSRGQTLRIEFGPNSIFQGLTPVVPPAVVRLTHFVLDKNRWALIGCLKVFGYPFVGQYVVRIMRASLLRSRRR
jgi:hypothetical protein